MDVKKGGTILMMHYQNATQIAEYKLLIASMIYEYDLSRFPRLSTMAQKYLQDTQHTLQYLSISLTIEEPLIFSNYMKWFGQVAYYLHFHFPSISHHFDACKHIFSKVFEEDLFIKASKVFDQGVEVFRKSYDSTKPRDVIQSEFLVHLINMESDLAYQYIAMKMEQGSSIHEVFLEIFQPTLYQVGELWQQRIITVAKEHYITAAIQHIIGKLYPMLFANKSSSTHSITAVCAGNELHEIGMRMIADFFELEGWDSHYLGSNLAAEFVVEQLLSHPTDVLAISATTSTHLVEVKQLITMVKNHEALKHTTIMVGGKVFNDTPNLWKLLGADLFASDPKQAIRLANLFEGEAHA